MSDRPEFLQREANDRLSESVPAPTATPRLVCGKHVGGCRMSEGHDGGCDPKYPTTSEITARVIQQVKDKLAERFQIERVPGADLAWMFDQIERKLSPRSAPDSSPPSPLEELLKEVDGICEYLVSVSLRGDAQTVRRLAGALRESLRESRDRGENFVRACNEKNDYANQLTDALRELRDSRSSVASLTEERDALIAERDDIEARAAVMWIQSECQHWKAYPGKCFPCVLASLDEASQDIVRLSDKLAALTTRNAQLENDLPALSQRLAEAEAKLEAANKNWITYESAWQRAADRADDESRKLSAAVEQIKALHQWNVMDIGANQGFGDFDQTRFLDRAKVLAAL